MTEISQKILKHYQVRKSKKQKDTFIDFLQSNFPELTVETYKGSRSKNLILGDPVRAKILVSAHYDTCAWMPVPNFITPLNPLLTVIYSIALLIPIFMIEFILNLILSLMAAPYLVLFIFSLILLYAMLGLMILGPANTHTANDNTSGVIGLCELYQSLTAEQRKNVCIIFFDNEEKGLLGSGTYRKKHKKAIKNQLLINLDCISDGDHFLLAITKKARNSYLSEIKESFQNNGSKTILLKKAEYVYYPSDQAGFPLSIAIAALKHKKLIGYYMDRIHTNRDTIMDERNIELLQTSICNLIHAITKECADC